VGVSVKLAIEKKKYDSIILHLFGMICYLVAVLIGVCDFPPKKWGSLPDRLLFSTRRSGMQFPGILGFVRLKDQLGVSTKSLQFHFATKRAPKRSMSHFYR